MDYDVTNKDLTRSIFIIENLLTGEIKFTNDGFFTISKNIFNDYL